MSDALKEIKTLLKSDLQKFETVFSGSVKTQVSLLDTILNYIVKRKGKQVRPMFVLLSAGCFGTINDRSFRGASLVELLHTATLVHDDVVDESYKRRGFFSINALWKNKIAVLVGDFLLSRGLILSVQNKDFDLLEIATEAVQRMSEGELLQLEKARKLDITEKDYFDIIGKKTASLFSACTAIGAASTSQSKEAIENMKNFGEFAGIAFQIKDDLFDFASQDTGKPKGIDIKERKMTLPLIYALKQAPAAERKKIIRTFKKRNLEQKEVLLIIRFIEQSGGVRYAQDQMQLYLDKAAECLMQVPDNQYKKMIQALLQFVINRTK